MTEAHTSARTACLWCGGGLGRARRGKRYCCDACRAAAARHRRGLDHQGIAGRVASVSHTRGGGRAVTVYVPPAQACGIEHAEVGAPARLSLPGDGGDADA